MPFVIREFCLENNMNQIAILIEQPYIWGASIVSTDSLDF